MKKQNGTQAEKLRTSDLTGSSFNLKLSEIKIGIQRAHLLLSLVEEDISSIIKQVERDKSGEANLWKLDSLLECTLLLIKKIRDSELFEAGIIIAEDNILDSLNDILTGSIITSRRALKHRTIVTEKKSNLIIPTKNN